MAKSNNSKTKIKLKPVKPSTEVAVESGITEVESIDEILAEKLSGDTNAYRDLLIDWNVFGCWQQRQTALTKLERQVIPADPDNKADVEAAEFVEAQLKRLNIDEVLKAMQYGVFYGYAVGEVMWGVEDGKVTLDNIIVRDRAKFKFNPQKQLIFTGNDSETVMPDRKFWTFKTGGDTTDNPYGLGLAHFLFWLVLFKKSNVKFWLLGNEKMATSVPHVQYDPRAKDVAEERKKALKAGIMLKNGAAIATAQGTVVELLKGVAGTADYEKLCRYVDEGIAQVILGQVMTSQSVGGQYKAEVQDSVKDDIVKADADLLCASLNNTVVKWLTEWNFPNAKPPKVWLLTQDEIDQQATSTTYANIAKLGYRPTLDTVTDTLGGEWEEIPTVATSTEEKANDKGEDEENSKDAKNFAEAEEPTHDFSEETDNPPFTDTELNLLLAKDFETLLQIDASDREALSQQIITRYPHLSFSEFQQFLTKVIFVSEVLGQHAAQTDSEASNE